MHNPEYGDYIGGESCLDLRPDVTGIFPWCGGAAAEASHRPRRLRRFESDTTAEKEYPPPIPLLVRNENPPPQIPWVMTRHYTSDGRLVIVEERARRHEYFHSQRSDGRLIINLVALESDDADDDSWELEQCAAGEGEEERENAEVDGDRIGGGVDGVPAEEAALPEECYTYNGIGVNPACGGYEVATAATAAF